MIKTINMIVMKAITDKVATSDLTRPLGLPLGGSRGKLFTGC